MATRTTVINDPVGIHVQGADDETVADNLLIILVNAE